ncbi:cytosolic phospholipase A2 gamma-like [Lepisosteus oculatus]|uniref:cytosolic phospholipase A2 gamma-like n=1 Tax=Lepisosteus oculatus TaxID=7918 RepID=UPI0035F5045B
MMSYRRCKSKDGYGLTSDCVPPIAVLGSGGGLRATVALMGTLTELGAQNLLDTIMYLCGVSGSTWCMSSLYRTWFEITRHEAGYPEYGAFVDTSALGSQFHGGNKIKHKDEMDMLCLQGLCGSAIGDMKENIKFLIEKIISFFKDLFHPKRKLHRNLLQSSGGRPPSEDVFSFYNDVEEDEEDLSLGDECEKRAMIFCLLKLHWNVLCGKDCKHILNSMKNIVKDEKVIYELVSLMYDTWDVVGKDIQHRMISALSMVVLKHFEEANEQLMVTTQATENAASYGNVTMNCDKSDVFLLTKFHEIHKMVSFWIWGTKHNFLYEYPNTDNRLPRNLVTEDKIYLIDAGLSINSAYPLVLRRDRGVQLILSFDFSEGDPFMTVTKAAEYCDKNKIPFPPIPVSEEEKNCPASVYIFKGTNTPTVMHFPLFNKDNCGGEEKIEAMRETYTTFKRSYSENELQDLLKAAKKNVEINRNKIVAEIQNAVDAERRKKHQ